MRPPAIAADLAPEGSKSAGAVKLAALASAGHYRAQQIEAATRARLAMPDEIVLRVLAIELKLLGSGKLLRLERLEFLAERLAQALRAGMGYGATLGGTVLRLNSNRTLIIVKEKARRRGRTTPHTLS